MPSGKPRGVGEHLDTPGKEAQKEITNANYAMENRGFNNGGSAFSSGRSNGANPARSFARSFSGYASAA